jgi:signal transduction histidine kinase
VTRHAGNAPCTVRLAGDGGALTFSVRDTGPGFDADATPRGMGMQIMHDRVDALDGELSFASAPGAGTTVTVRLPLHIDEVVT